MGLPGSHLAVPAGSMCDTHETLPATHNIQGETDSFGCENHLMCDECYAAYQIEAAKPTMGYCDYCMCPRGSLPKPGTEQVEVVPYRDPDEGSSGPVYWLCRPCRRKANQLDADDEMNDICPCGRVNCVEEDGHWDIFDMQQEEFDEDDRS